jgi:hypothetical protein
MPSKSDNISNSCLLLICGFLLIPVEAIWRGYVLVRLWGWFIVPVFHITAINIPEGIGLSLVVSYLTYQYIRDKEDKDDYIGNFIRSIGVAVLWPAFALLFGWIVQHWM